VTDNNKKKIELEIADILKSKLNATYVKVIDTTVRGSGCILLINYII